MKISSILSLTSLLVILVSVITSVEAGRKKGGRKKIKQCVYSRKGECNQETGQMTYQLKRSRPGYSCPPIKIKMKKCPGCIYLKNTVQFGECQDGTMTKMAPLASGSAQGCPPTRLISRKCKDWKTKEQRKKDRRARKGKGKGKGKRRGRKRERKNKGRRMGRKGRGRKRGGTVCVYKNKDWSECDEATNTRQRERELVSGDPQSCLPKKTVTKKCKKECRYVRSEWSECDNITKAMNRTLEPKPGSLPQCESKVQTRPCFVGADSRMRKPTKCRYKFGSWSECDTRTNTMTREMVLRKGDPNLCKRTVKLTRKCKLACKFKQGKWSKCDKMTRLKQRIDTLKKGSPTQCERQRTITKKCNKATCKYRMGSWSECSADDNMRTRTKYLLSHKNGAKCKSDIVIKMPCLDKNGTPRCFFGSWGEFGPCTNGVMTKQRTLLQGGVECERRAVVTKACFN